MQTLLWKHQSKTSKRKSRFSQPNLQQKKGKYKYLYYIINTLLFFYNYVNRKLTTFMTSFIIEWCFIAELTRTKPLLLSNSCIFTHACMLMLWYSYIMSISIGWLMHFFWQINMYLFEEEVMSSKWQGYDIVQWFWSIYTCSKAIAWVKLQKIPMHLSDWLMQFNNTFWTLLIMRCMDLATKKKSIHFIIKTIMLIKQGEDRARSFEQSMKKMKVPLFVVPSPRVDEVLLFIAALVLYTQMFSLYFYRQRQF